MCSFLKINTINSLHVQISVVWELQNSQFLLACKLIYTFVWIWLQRPPFCVKIWSDICLQMLCVSGSKQCSKNKAWGGMWTFWGINDVKDKKYLSIKLSNGSYSGLPLIMFWLACSLDLHTHNKFGTSWMGFLSYSQVQKHAHKTCSWSCNRYYHGLCPYWQLSIVLHLLSFNSNQKTTAFCLCLLMTRNVQINNIILATNMYMYNVYLISCICTIKQHL